MSFLGSKLRFSYLILRNILFRELEYRAHYYLMLVSFFISFAADYLILKFSHGGRQSFVSEEGILSFVIFGLVVRSSSMLWGQSLVFESEIRNGDFRRYLLQPVNFSEIFAATALGEKAITWSMMLVSYLLILFIVGADKVIIPHWSFIPFLALSIMLVWTIYYTITLLTFWLHETSFMNISFNISVGIFSGTIVPFDWLPTPIQTFVSYTPFKAIGDYPMRAAFSQLGPSEVHQGLSVSLLWLVALWMLNFSLYEKGVRRYESFGG